MHGYGVQPLQDASSSFFLVIGLGGKGPWGFVGCQEGVLQDVLCFEQGLQLGTHVFADECQQAIQVGGGSGLDLEPIAVAPGVAQGQLFGVSQGGPGPTGADQTLSLMEWVGQAELLRIWKGKRWGRARLSDSVRDP